MNLKFRANNPGVQMLHETPAGQHQIAPAKIPDKKTVMCHLQKFGPAMHFHAKPNDKIISFQNLELDIACHMHPNGFGLIIDV